MFSFFRRKTKMEFIQRIEGVKELMPIIPAAQYKHPWVGRLAADRKKQRERPDYGMQTEVHTAKCPGIFGVLQNGWILRTWQDLTIETNGDGITCNWTSAMSQAEMCRIDAFSFHPPSQLTDFLENWDGAIRQVLKFQTGWSCIVPKGYVLMEMPVAYSDDDRFEVLPGMHHVGGYTELNPQTKWKVKSGKTLIKAGTPIAQYMLVKQEEFDMTMRLVDPKELRFAKLILDHVFVRNVKNFKEFHQKFMT